MKSILHGLGLIHGIYRGWEAAGKVGGRHAQENVDGIGWECTIHRIR